MISQRVYFFDFLFFFLRKEVVEVVAQHELIRLKESNGLLSITHGESYTMNAAIDASVSPALCLLGRCCSPIVRDSRLELSH